MFKEVKLYDEAGNEINVPMKSNAGTAIRFRNSFHEEIPISGDMRMIYMSIITKENISIDEDIDINKLAVVIDKGTEKIQKLAFIMAMSAAGEKMDELNYEKYISWIEKLDLKSFTEEKQEEIWGVYSGSSNNSSEAKKKSDQAAET